MKKSQRGTRGLVVGVALAVGLAGGCSFDGTPAPDLPSVTTTAGATPGASLSPAATPGSPPSPGSVASAVKSSTTPRRKPVSLSTAGEAASKVQVELTRLTAITAEASGPGEVAGPALQVEVRLRNGTSRAVRTDRSAITLTAADGSPGAAISGAPASPLPPSVAAGQEAVGTYVFTVPSGRRRPVTVDVSVDPTLTTVVFRGPAPS